MYILNHISKKGDVKVEKERANSTNNRSNVYAFNTCNNNTIKHNK